LPRGSVGTAPARRLRWVARGSVGTAPARQSASCKGGGSFCLFWRGPDAARDPKPPTPPRCGGSVRARAASRVAGRLGIGTEKGVVLLPPPSLWTGPGRLRSGSSSQLKTWRWRLTRGGHGGDLCCVLAFPFRVNLCALLTIAVSLQSAYAINDSAIQV